MPEHDVREGKKGNAMKRMSLHQTGQPTRSCVSSTIAGHLVHNGSSFMSGTLIAQGVRGNIAIDSAPHGAG